MLLKVAELEEDVGGREKSRRAGVVKAFIQEPLRKKITW